MLSIKKILVPYDFSPFSREALGFSARLARLTGAELHVMHVEMLHGASLVETPSEPVKGEVLHKRVEEENEDLQSLLGDCMIVYAVWRDIAPGPSIVHYADRNDIDVIIMGTHGRKGFRRFLLGSVTEEVVRHAECPVLTIPERNSEGDNPLTIKRILVPTDFSKHSKEALIYAKALAALLDARLDLLHVVHLPSRVTFYDTGLFSVYEYQSEVDTYAHDELQEFFDNSYGPEVNDVVFSVEYDLEPDGIVKYAEENKSDLVVMGTHGRTGMSRFLLGNVTAKTIRRLPCPAFVVRSFGKSLVQLSDEEEMTLLEN